MNKSTQHANTNLDQDLTSSRSIRYQSTQEEVKVYLQQALPDIQLKYAWQLDLMELLHDGAILCHLGTKIKPDGPCKKYKNSKMPFIQMENVSFFLGTCELMGLQHDEIFQTIDLYELADPYQVIVTLMSFSRLANKSDPNGFPSVIGPKVFKAKPQVPVKPYKLRG